MVIPLSKSSANTDCFTQLAFERVPLKNDPNSVTEYMIRSYRSGHYKPREISLDLVNDSINELEMAIERKKGGAGAKIKNMDIGELAKRLSYIHRIDKFLNQNKITSIKEYPLSNESCRFIYEYFYFWKLLPKDIKFEISEKEKKANYIKSLIRNNENCFESGSLLNARNFMYIIDKGLEWRIDLFKEVKDGLITPKEYNEKLTSFQY